MPVTTAILLLKFTVYLLTIKLLYIKNIYLMSELMIMASHQEFSNQFKYLPGKAKFDQTNLLNNINEKFIQITKNTECLDNFHKVMACIYIHKMFFLQHAYLRLGVIIT